MNDKNNVNRRGFLGGLGAGAMGSLAFNSNAKADPSVIQESFAKSTLPAGKPLRVLPVLVYHLESPKEMTSWRSYGDLHNQSEVDAEAKRIEKDLQYLAVKTEFPIQVLPLQTIGDETQAKTAAASESDMIVMFASGGGTSLYVALTASKAVPVMFIRHQTKPNYLFHEIAHWRFLRRSEDAMTEPNMDVDDIVVDDYNELIWRMRAVYGLKNAKGTKMLAIGSLTAYSEPAQKNGPTHAKDVWDYEIEIIPRPDFAQRLKKARASANLVKEIERQTITFLERPGLTLATQQKFVFNSFLTLHVCRELLNEKQASNFGFDLCMGREVIEMLGTPPCLVLALANDEGFTAYCHTDLSHTCPGVFLRWTTGKPTFLCNTHFPHDGIFTVAHCSAPMKMNGIDNEPVTVMTHYESNFGAATRVQYTKGQTVTVIIPDLHCTQWQGFRGNILSCPNLPACRSQMDISIDGNERALIQEMEGFHAQIVYGDYLREVGYALKRINQLKWRNFSQKA